MVKIFIMTCLVFFETFVRPFDMELMTECTTDTRCNILHICDWEGPYDDISAFAAYPGEIVNTPNVVGGSHLRHRMLQNSSDALC